MAKLHGRGVRVNSVAPGLVAAPWTADWGPSTRPSASAPLRARGHGRRHRRGLRRLRGHELRDRSGADRGRRSRAHPVGAGSPPGECRDGLLAPYGEPLAQAHALGHETSDGHTQWYVERFRALAAEADLAGEARLVDAMLPRAARVLDAGCGTGRVGAELHARGPARSWASTSTRRSSTSPISNHPAPAGWSPTWQSSDLAAMGRPSRSTLTIMSSNVMVFIAPAPSATSWRGWPPTWRPTGS